MRNDRSEEITEQLKKSEKKGGPSFRGSHGPMYRETSHSFASSNSNNPNNILYENVVMPHMQSTFDNQPVYMIEGENIKEEDEEISSSNTFSSKSKTRSHDRCGDADQSSTEPRRAAVSRLRSRLLSAVVYSKRSGSFEGLDF